MRKVKVLGLFLVILNLHGVYALQTDTVLPAKNLTDTEQEIIKLSQQKWLWMADRQIDSLETLFHEKAVFVHMGGTMSREHELNVIKGGMIQYKKLTFMKYG